MTYQAFVDLVAEMAVEGKVTGHQQSEKLLEKSLMNLYFMKQVKAEIDLSEGLAKALRKVDRDWHWFVLMEGWCHDGAQNVPILASAAAATSRISLSILLRDENSEIMNQYLTNGTRGIPKLVCVDTETQVELGTWGPRPVRIQEKVLDFKKKHFSAGRDEFSRNLKLWYADDAGQALQKELEALVGDWMAKSDEME